MVWKKGNVPWNVGLTKETDNRVKACSEHIKGHIPWNKDLTIETDERVKKYGKKISIRRKLDSSFKNSELQRELSKRRWSKIGAREKHSKLVSGENHPLFGKHLTEATRAKLRISSSIASKKMWQKFPKELYPNFGMRGKKFPVDKYPYFGTRSTKVPFKDTSIEVKLQNELTKLAVLFEAHRKIENRWSDLFIEPNIVIFADGCYFHSCKQCYDKNRFTNWQEAALVRDGLITQMLLNKGYVVLRFWEHEINSNLEIVVNKIYSTVKNTQQCLKLVCS